MTTVVGEKIGETINPTDWSADACRARLHGVDLQQVSSEINALLNRVGQPSTDGNTDRVLTSDIVDALARYREIDDADYILRYYYGPSGDN